MKQFFIALITLMLAGAGGAVAQKLLTVTGRTVDASSGGPYAYAHIYVLKNKELLDAAKQQYEVNKEIGRELFGKDVLGLLPFDLPYKQGLSDMEGKYIMYDVPEDGYLMFLPYNGKPEYLSVNGMLELPDVPLKDERMLETVTVEGSSGRDSTGYMQCGRMLHLDCNMVVNPKYLKDYMRMVIMPFYTECSMTGGKVKNDTVFLDPICYNGRQFKATQTRRLNFNLRKDPLYSHFIDSITLNEFNRMKVRYSIALPDAKKHYTVKAFVHYEDYNSVWEERETFLKFCQDNKPMRFLEVTYEDAMLNPADPDFKVNPDVDVHNAVGTINLTFKVNSAELDADNPNNAVEIARLQDEMLAIESSSRNTLNSLSIVAKSSPEGAYEANLALADRRVQSATRQIVAGLGQYTRNRLQGNIKQDAVVAGWDELADTLAANGLAAEADEVRSVVAQYPNRHDQQSAAIYQLACYPMIKEKYLPKLRSVQYQYTYKTMRALNDKEILVKYTDWLEHPDKKVLMTRYDYWRLVNTVKDSAMLAGIYKRYYDFTKRPMRRTDELAACNYVAYCIRQGIVDTTALKPYIDQRVKKVDVRTVNSREEDMVINRSAIIKNQALMYMLAEEYPKALGLCHLLPEGEERKRLDAFIRCLHCDYDNDEYANLVMNTSPINKIVILLARKDYHVAVPMLEERIADTDPRKFYMLAQVKQVTTVDNGEAVAELLLKCFKLDESYLETARGDAAFLDFLGQSKGLDTAEKQFLKWKEGQQK